MYHWLATIDQRQNNLDLPEAEDHEREKSHRHTNQLCTQGAVQQKECGKQPTINVSTATGLSSVHLSKKQKTTLKVPKI